MATMTHESIPDQGGFRSAMANLSAGVCVLTTDGAYGRGGTTVSASCSVTDAPPTVVVCVNRSATSYEAFANNEAIAINILSSEHEDIALIFANATDVPRERRFDDERWDLTTHGVPVLGGAAASVVGRVASVVEQGSHSVFFVEVRHVASRPEASGLVYFQRRFHEIGSV